MPGGLALTNIIYTMKKIKKKYEKLFKDRFCPFLILINTQLNGFKNVTNDLE